MGAGPLYGHGREVVPVFVIRAVGAEREVAVQAQGLDLETGSHLEVAGEKAQSDPRVPGEGLDDRHHPRLGAHVLGPQALAQAAQVRAEHVGQAFLDRCTVEAGASHQLAHDLGVGLARVVVARERPLGTEVLQQGLAEGRCRDARGGEQRAVDVEEDEAALLCGKVHAQCTSSGRGGRSSTGKAGGPGATARLS